MVAQESFNKAADHPLQTWEWGELRKAAGNEVIRFPFGQITIHPIPFTKYKVGAFIKADMPTKEIIEALSFRALIRAFQGVLIHPLLPYCGEY